MKNNPRYLYELLREKRNKLARDTNVEPYMILHNKVLLEIVDKQPKTLDDLGNIKGIGQKKLAKYGNLILETLNNQDNSQNSSNDENQKEKVFSVSEYINFINQILIPQKAIVVGEVSSVKFHDNYSFFSLQDKNQDALLNCFVWQNRLDNFGIELKEGMELKVIGFPKIYEKTGTVSFQVDHLGLIGEGALKLAFEKLKKKLEKEGYFDEDRKKKVPEYVHNIGLITSKYGDAVKDFRTNLGNFGIKINFFDVRVEGVYAIDDIVSAIHWFNENFAEIEVLVLVRGGGSLESLQAFNSEPVAKAIFSSRIPIITGIGHENDITIADLVADERTSTPTGASRILSDPWRNALTLLTNLQTNISSRILISIRQYKNMIINNNEEIISSFNRFIKNKIQRIDDIQALLRSQFINLLNQAKDIQNRFLNNWEKLKNQFNAINHKIKSHGYFLLFVSKQWFEKNTKNLSNLAEKLALGSPEARLKQGYSIITNIDRRVIKSNKQIKVGDSLNLKFYQGRASSKVEGIIE